MSKIKNIVFLCIILMLPLIGYYISEVSIVNFFKILIAYIGYVFLPGLFIYRLFNFTWSKIKFDFLLIPNLIGLFLIFIVDFITIKFDTIYILWVVPIIVGVLNYLINQPIKKSDINDFKYLGFLILLVLSVFSIYTIGTPSLDKVDVYNYYMIDKFWHAGNSYSFDLGFFPPNLHVDGMIFRYHFFDDWLIGILNKITGVSVLDISFYYVIPIYLIILCISLYSFGNYFFKEKRVWTIIFSVSLLFITSISSSLTLNVFHVHIFKNPNAVLPALIILIIVSLLIIERLSEMRWISFKELFLIIIGVIVLAGFKSPFAVLLPLILICVVILKFLLTQKIEYNTVILSCSLLIVYVIFHGVFLNSDSVSSVEIFSLGTVRNSFIGNMASNYKLDTPIFLMMLIPIHFIIFLPFQGILILISLIFVLKKLKRITSVELFLLGMAFSGIIIMYLLYHEGKSHYYFFFASLLFINLIAIQFLKKCYDLRKENKKYVLLFYGILLIGGALFSIQILKDLKNNYNNAYIKKFTVGEDGVITKYEKEALEWLRDNSKKNDVFVTNRHTESLKKDTIGAKKGKFFYYTAFSGRQAFIGGYFYTSRKRKIIKNNGVDKEYFIFKDKVYENMKINNSIFNKENIKAYLKDYNIRFIVNNKLAENNLNGIDKEYIFLDKVFENKIIEIYKYVHLDEKF